MCSIDCSIQEIRLNKKVVVTWPDGKKYKGIVNVITEEYITIWYPEDITYSDDGSRTDHPIKGLKFKRTRKRKTKKRTEEKPKPEKVFEEEPEPEPKKKCVSLSDDKFRQSQYQLETERVARLLLGLFNQ